MKTVFVVMMHLEPNDDDDGGSKPLDGFASKAAAEDCVKQHKLLLAPILERQEEDDELSDEDRAYMSALTGRQEEFAYHIDFDIAEVDFHG